MSKRENTNRMKMISSLAKKLYATGKYKKWTDAISAASKQLKKEGEL